MHFGIIVFPGTNCEHDTLHVVCDVLGHSGSLVWHEATDLSPFDGVILPGGFAHGDYLRTGAVARFSPVMDAVAQFAAAGKPVLGICNGFQILCEAGLLPGALRRNYGSHFVCRDVHLRVETNANPFTQFINVGAVIKLPIRHGEGSYYADEDTIAEMEANGQIVLRYAHSNGEIVAAMNPNGSTGSIAGVCNEAGNVFGLMPPPEAASEASLGNTDGLIIFQGMTQLLETSRPRSGDGGYFNV